MKPIRLLGPAQRAHACTQVMSAPDGYVVRVSEPTRSLDQNARLWATLEEVARAEPLGRKHTPDEWKAIFMQATGWESAFLPGLSGGFFPIGFRSSRLTVRQMADLITYIHAFCAEQRIPLSEPNPDERAA
jgi:hypothetical protein